MKNENFESELRKIIREIVKEESDKVTKKDADNLVKSIRDELHKSVSRTVKEHLVEISKYIIEKIGKEE